ncbi:MAG: DinB family protein [Acidobacteriota bacterium]|nr:DinB family protein [Acidobacteriota bacterium]
MSIAQELLAEFEQQAPVTRRFLERLPEERLTWKPHAKSMTAGQLAYHLATIPGGVVRGAQSSQIAPPGFKFPQPESLAQVLKTFDESAAAVREVMPTFDDAAMNALWRIVAGEQELLAIPRREFLRAIMLNHWYQHRGQFSVYLRMLDVAVPSSWGPSADETAPSFQLEEQMA